MNPLTSNDAAASSPSSSVAPNEQILNSVSPFPPSLTSGPSLGTIAAWMDPSGVIYIASDDQDPPYQGEAVNPSWLTTDTPAVELAMSRNDVYLAWLTSDGSINLGSAADGWQQATVLAEAKSAKSGPALLFSDEGNLLYVAWQNAKGYLNFGTVDANGNFQSSATKYAIDSRPSLMLDGENFYVLSGGASLGSGGPMLMFLSADQGKSFNSVNPPLPFFSVGPPALVNLNGTYCIVYAAPPGSTLTAVYTNTAFNFFSSPAQYSDSCYAGGPAAVLSTDGTSITTGWSYNSTDSRQHHITLAELPTYTGNSAANLRRADAPISSPQLSGLDKLYRVGAPVGEPNRCPDPTTVYDPASGKCVSKLGCWGGCVLSSVNPYKGFFNPIAYAICVARCTK